MHISTVVRTSHLHTHWKREEWTDKGWGKGLDGSELNWTYFEEINVQDISTIFTQISANFWFSSSLFGNPPNFFGSTLQIFLGQASKMLWPTLQNVLANLKKFVATHQSILATLNTRVTLHNNSSTSLCRISMSMQWLLCTCNTDTLLWWTVW